LLPAFFPLMSTGTYRCACCDEKIGAPVYREGAFFCQPCARGEHRHAGWGRNAA